MIHNNKVLFLSSAGGFVSQSISKLGRFIIRPFHFLNSTLTPLAIKIGNFAKTHFATQNTGKKIADSPASYPSKEESELLKEWIRGDYDTNIKNIDDIPKDNQEKLRSFLIQAIELHHPKVTSYLLNLVEKLPDDFQVAPWSDPVVNASFVYNVITSNKEKGKNFLELLKRLEKTIVFTNGIHKNDYEYYQEMINYGYVIEYKIIKDKLDIKDYVFIDKVLAKMPESWWEEHGRSILEDLAEREDPITMKIILKHCPRIASYCSLELFAKTLDAGKKDFVSFLLTNGFIITEKDIREKQLIASALRTNNLDLLCTFCEYAKKAGMVECSYPEILKIDESTLNDKEKMKELLFGFAMNSSLLSVYQLVRHYPQMYAVLPDVIRKTALLVRFPNFDMVTESEVNKVSELGDRSRDDYIQASHSYADKNLTFINNTLPSLPTMKRIDVLREMIKNRKKEDGSHYNKLQIDESYLSHTDIMANKRYSHSLRHLRELQMDNEKNEWGNAYNQEVITSSYLLPRSYPPGRSERVRTSVVRPKEWNHPTKEYVEQFQSHLEDLHKEIIEYQINPSDPTSKKTLLEKITRVYWLMSTLCEAWRGTPHNVMIWLNLVYAHHGLPPPVPVRDHFFLDNTMLMTPFVERAIEKWDSYFEPTLDQALEYNSEQEKYAYLKEIIHQHPDLLTLCSLEAREKLQSMKSEVSNLDPTPLSDNETLPQTSQLTPTQALRLQELRTWAKTNVKLTTKEWAEFNQLKALENTP